MERTKYNENPTLDTLARLQTLSALVERFKLNSRLGSDSFNGNRDLYETLGYPKELRYEDYTARYFRQDLAKAIIDRPVNLTWSGDLKIQESKDDKDTPLEQAWTDLLDEFKLKSIFSRADRLACMGCYSVILLGLDDVKTPEDFARPAIGKRKLMYVKPFGEGSAVIKELETNTKDSRYGQPKIYTITIVDTNRGSASNANRSSSNIQVDVHYSRIIHVVYDILENETIGIPVLEVVYNRLMDIEKLVGGDAEMFWKGARPGYQGKLDENFDIDDAGKASLDKQIDEYEHGLRRLLLTRGVNFTELAQQIADPKNHVDVHITLVSAVTGIPKRILSGSERGELSSSQDSEEWRTYVKDRRENHAETHIVREFVDRMQDLQILPEAGTGNYQVIWSDLFALSEKDMVEIGKGRASALKEYNASPVNQSIVPPKAFFQYFLGLDSDKIDLITEMMEADMTEESKMMKDDPTTFDVDPVTGLPVEPKPVEPVRPIEPTKIIRTK